MPGDLHSHSTFSDGWTPIEEMPFLAAKAGLSHLAVSDHDSAKAVRWAYEHPQVNGVAMIPATELSTFDPDTGRRVHLLAYWPQLCPALQAHCAMMADRRNAACTQSIRELEALYPQFKAEMVQPYLGAGGVLFKSNIMRVFRDLGLSDTIYGSLYRRFFSAGEPRGIVLHKTGYEPVESVLAVAHESRAVVVLAHPSEYQSMALCRRLAAEGKIDGIEVHHPHNTAADSAACHALCERYHLIETGGTDYHGFDDKHLNPIGTCTTADDAVQRIHALAMARQTM